MINVDQRSFRNEHVDFADENGCLIQKDQNTISPLTDGFSHTQSLLLFTEIWLCLSGLPPMLDHFGTQNDALKQRCPSFQTALFPI